MHWHIRQHSTLYSVSSGFQILRSVRGPKVKKTPIVFNFRFMSLNQRLESGLAYSSITEVREMATLPYPSCLFLLVVLNVTDNQEHWATVWVDWRAHWKRGFALQRVFWAWDRYILLLVYAYVCMHTNRAGQSLRDFCHHPVNHYWSRAVFFEISDLFFSPEGFIAASSALAGVWIACWQPASWPRFRAQRYRALQDCPFVLLGLLGKWSNSGFLQPRGSGWHEGQGVRKKQLGEFSLGDNGVTWTLWLHDHGFRTEEQSGEMGWCKGCLCLQWTAPNTWNIRLKSYKIHTYRKNF